MKPPKLTQVIYLILRIGYHRSFFNMHSRSSRIREELEESRTKLTKAEKHRIWQIKLRGSEQIKLSFHLILPRGTIWVSWRGGPTTPRQTTLYWSLTRTRASTACLQMDMHSWSRVSMDPQETLQLAHLKLGLNIRTGRLRETVHWSFRPAKIWVPQHIPSTFLRSKWQGGTPHRTIKFKDRPAEVRITKTQIPLPQHHE